MTRLDATATTEEILEELGARLRRYRLQQNRTVAEIAELSGLSRVTVERAERGSHPTLETVIRILRALGRVESLNAFLPPPLVSPLELAQMSGRERKRAGTPRTPRSPRSPRSPQDGNDG